MHIPTQLPTRIAKAVVYLDGHHAPSLGLTIYPDPFNGAWHIGCDDELAELSHLLAEGEADLDTLPDAADIYAAWCSGEHHNEIEEVDTQDIAETYATADLDALAVEAGTAGNTTLYLALSCLGCRAEIEELIEGKQ